MRDPAFVGSPLVAEHFLRALRGLAAEGDIVSAYVDLKARTGGGGGVQIAAVRLVKAGGQLDDRYLKPAREITRRPGRDEEATVVGTWYGEVIEVEDGYFIARVTEADSGDDRDEEALQRFPIGYVTADEQDRVVEGATFTWVQETVGKGVLTTLHFDVTSVDPATPSPEVRHYAKRAVKARMPEIQ